MKINYSILITVFSVIFGSGFTVFAADIKSEIAENPLRSEMLLLDKAFKNLIDSLLLNNLNIIEGLFHDVHHARHKTDEALKNGAIVLPKNNDKVKEFISIDEEFHHKLEKLIAASKKGDAEQVKKITHNLLDVCIQCHMKFRN